MTDPMIAVLPGAEAFEEALELPAVEMKFDAFPDGESYVRCLSDVAGREVSVLAQLNDPDPQIMRLVLTARTLSSLGAKRVGLVAPYLPYLRQDIAFNTGESVSAQHFGWLVSSVFDWVVTVDPHLHRLSSLSDVLTVPSAAVSSAGPVADWIRANVDAPLLVGPDMESHQWLETLSDKLGGVPFHAFEKTRHDSWTVEIASAQIPDLAGRSPVIIDDIASTGRTLLRLRETLHGLTDRQPACCVTHGVFRDDVRDSLQAAFNGCLVTTNTIAGPTAKIDVSAGVRAAIEALTS